ncbi:MAG TPA: S-layer homology domain-containing protein [Chloroflexia bacterium]
MPTVRHVRLFALLMAVSVVFAMVIAADGVAGTPMSAARAAGYPAGKQDARPTALADEHLGIFPPVPNSPDELMKADPYRQFPRALPPVVRGVPGDLWADVIIGKPRFSDINPFTTTSNKLFWAHGTIVDRTSTANKLYVYDSGNNRILGFNLADCLARPGDPLNCSADIVIGQPDMSHAGCNGDSAYQNYPNRAPASASSLCGQIESQLSITEGGSGSSMAIDGAGNLYVTDFFNSRVLKYNQPFATDQVADDVWGQDNFTGNRCNKGQGTPNATTLCFTWGNSNNWTAGVDVDSQGNIWVVDSGNNRVLRFPAGSHTADLVIGQASFTSSAPGSSLNRLRDPSAARISSRGWLYVADHGNDRVMVYEPVFTTNMNGRKFGPTLPPNPNPEPFWQPSGIDLDPSLPGVWIMNQQHSTFERWDEDSQTLLQTIGRRDDGNLLYIATGSIGIDAPGNKFIAVGSGSGNYRGDVLMFEPGSPGNFPSKQLFGVVWQGNQMTASGLGSGAGVAIADNKLMVADAGRLLFWNNPQSLVSGQQADGVAGGVNDFTSHRDGCCYNLKVSDGYIWTMKGDGQLPEQIEVYQRPLSQSAQSVATIQYPLNVLGGGQINGSGPFWGHLPTSDNAFLWLSNRDTNRVFRVRNPLTNPVVDVILGQTDINGTLCNRSTTWPPNPAQAQPDTLCMPGSLSFDRLGNLYVSDHSLEANGNRRLLVFNANLFPTNNSQVIFAPPASKIFPNTASWEPAFDSQNRMVVGYNPYFPESPGTGWFPGVYNNPLGPSTTPDALLYDYYSMAFSATFDEFDNLYIGDLDRSRVLIYHSPLSPPTSTPTAVASPTPSSIPTATSTAPSGATATSTAPPGATATSTSVSTSTPIASPTLTSVACLVEYSDVPPTNTFYSFVRCLACKGVMGGYADNTFRPNNDITRGQLSKIVSNAASFNDPVGGQTFKDVPSHNTFYPYVERMAGRGIIGGYPCGGENEPCGTDSKPYFRPNANATRGQISKIVSEARGYSDPQTGQTFEDVAVGSTFHLWIERLASRGIMGGYNCGGAGEPCGAGNKPYFRPNAKATRGQTSKIVANTFFPGCDIPGVRR